MPRERGKRLDVLVLNPPSPDGDTFLRDTIARVGRRTRDGIIWPQTALAQKSGRWSRRPATPWTWWTPSACT